MLDIILIILKIIGIILLVILGLILAICLSILFVPVRYGSNGQFEKKDEGFSYNVFAKVTWLLHIISVQIVANSQTEDNPIIKLRLFGIDLSKLYNKISIKKQSSQEKDSFENDKKEVIPSENDNNPSDDIKSSDNLILSADEEKTDDLKKTVSESISDASKQSHNEKTEKNSVNERISVDEKPKTEEKKPDKNKFNNFLNKFKEICDKIQNVKEVKDSFIDFLKREESKAAVREIKALLFKLLKHILPQKLKAYIHFGFEDPATTGQTLGVAAIFYGIYGDNLELQPDFENKALDGRYAFKGRIRMITLILTAWKLYRNKWIREFISFSKKSVKDL